MIPYRLFVDSEAVQFLNQLLKPQRTALWDILLAIGDNPTAYSDSSIYDPTGRLLQISRFKNFSITYWIDDADRHVKIIELKKL